MKKKIITASVLGLMTLTAMPVSATEQIAFAIFGASQYIDSCSTCHSARSGQESKGNLKAGINAAYQKDKFGLSALKTLVATPTVTCTLPQILNATKDACITPPPPKCVAPKILNDAQTACVNPPAPTCLDTQILKNNVCIDKPVVPTCVLPEVLNTAKTACITQPTTATNGKNTKPVLNAVAQQWDVQVGETPKIPLTVVDAEQDEFAITTSKLVGSSLSDVYQNDTGLPTIDFEWTPAQANVNKIQTLSFQAKEKSTKQKYTSNKIAVKVRVWAEGDRNNASITKLNVMTSKFSGGNLNLAGNVKFNNLLTATERQAFIEQTLDLTVNDANGSPIDSSPLTLDKQGKWAVSIPMTAAPCNITLEFAGQNASRKVVGCTKTAALNTNFLAENDDHDDDHNEKDKSKTKHND